MIWKIKGDRDGVFRQDRGKPIISLLNPGTLWEIHYAAGMDFMEDRQNRVMMTTRIIVADVKS